MKKYFVIIFLLTANTAAYSSNKSAMGIELDALPWLTGGYYVSGFYADENWRYRLVAAEVHVPDSFVENGFTNKEIKAVAAIVDYFPSADRQGVWYGAGLEYWQTRIQNSHDKSKAEYDNTVLTAGLGYVWQLTPTVYINPWAALHVIVDGDRDIQVGNRTYQQALITPSGSIKLGWQF